MAEKTLTSEPEFKKRYDLNNMTNIEFENFVDENYNEYGDFHGEGLIRDRVLTFDDHAPEDEKWTNQLTGEKAQTNWELAESYGLIGWQSGASDYSRAFQACAPSYFYEDADPDLHSLRHIPEIGNAANESLHGRIYMYNAVESSKMTSFTQEFTGIKYDGKTLSNYGGGTYQPKNTLSGIRFYLSAGNFTSGTVKIYGLEES